MHSLNLKITYRCTNHCPFCFASHLKSEEMSQSSQIEAIIQGYKNGCRSLVLSGGEPTLYPDRVQQLIRYANNLGYESYTLQTNGSGLTENNELVRFIEGISREKDCNISFSIHGHTRTIHDAMSGRDGAFDNLMEAIQRIAHSMTTTIMTNTIISSLNMDVLPQITDLLSQFQVDIMQFAVMHSGHKENFSIGLIKSVNAVRRLLQCSRRQNIRTEGLPYCLMYGFEKCVGESYWPNKLDLFNKSKSYISEFDQLDAGMRTKTACCTSCIMNEICVGVWAEHYEELTANTHPIR